MATTGIGASDLSHEVVGEGPSILLIHPSGATAATWGPIVGELARLGQVITYDRRGYGRSGGAPIRTVATHTADAAALLESMAGEPAVVVGVSSGAIIAVDLAVRRPDLVRAVVEHEGPWRYTRHVPTGSQLRTFASMAAFLARGRQGDAAEALLRAAYRYRDGGTAWDAFPEEWRRAARENARATLWDFITTIGSYPSAGALAGVATPVVCSYGSRSPDFIRRRTRAFAAAIPGARVRRIDGAAHAAPFDAPDAFVRLVGDTVGKGRTLAQQGGRQG
jgi:pimeloyl-ACP methyl ester carboxylesterase